MLCCVQYKCRKEKKKKLLISLSYGFPCLYHRYQYNIKIAIAHTDAYWHKFPLQNKSNNIMGFYFPETNM